MASIELNAFQLIHPIVEKSKFRFFKMGIAKKGSVFFFTFLITSVVNVLSIKFYTWYLSLNEYGTFSYLQGIFLITAALFSRWIVQATFRFKSQYDKEAKARAFNGVLVSIIIISIIIFTVLALIIHFYFAKSIIGNYIFQLYLITISILLVEVLNSWIQAGFDAKSYALGEVLRVVFRIAFPFLCMSLLGKSIYNFLYGYAVANILVLVVQVLILKPELEFDGKEILSTSKKLIKYGFPISIWFLCTQLTSYGDRLILLHYWSLEKVALYSANYQVFSFSAQVISLPLINTFHPLLLKYNIENKDELVNFERLLNRITNYYIVASFLVCTIILICSDYITDILLSKAYRLDIFTIYCIVFGTAIWNLGSYGNKPFEMRKQTIKMLKAVLISVSVFFILSNLFIPKMSYQGAALAKLISFASYPLSLFCMNQNENKKNTYPVKWELSFSKIFFLLFIPFAVAVSLHVFASRFQLNVYIDVVIRITIASLFMYFIAIRMIEKADLLLLKTKLFSYKSRVRNYYK